MATHLAHRDVRTEPWATVKTFSAGSAGILAAAGAVGIALGALGLAQVVRVSWDALAVFILGGALTLRAALSLMELNRARAGPGRAGRVAAGAFTAELCLGLVGTLFGLFALAGGMPGVLTAAGVLVLGAAMGAGSAASAELGRAAAAPDPSARKAVAVGSGLDSVLGAGAVVLGILALVGISPRPLVLISEIALGLGLVVIAAVLARRTPGARPG